MLTEQIIFVMQNHKPDKAAYNDMEYTVALDTWWFILNGLTDRLRLNDPNFNADSFVENCLK